jgi:type VI secretion system protein ImpK
MQKETIDSTLSDLCTDSFLLLIQLRASSQYGNAEILRNRILNLLSSLEDKARGLGIHNEKIESVKFALAAFFDETISGSEWDQKAHWINAPLQAHLFDTVNAGEEFFERLDEYRRRSSLNTDVLQVFYLCLTLGFKGKYLINSPEKIRDIVDKLGEELYGVYRNKPVFLSPNGHPKDEFTESMKRGLPIWLVGTIALAIAIVIYIIFSVFSSSNVSDVQETLSLYLNK